MRRAGRWEHIARPTFPEKGGCLMASGLKRIGDLDIHQDLPFQRRTWMVQRVSWAVMALAVLAAVLGLFGHGPLSETVAEDPAVPLKLTYERFGRYQSPLTLQLHVESRAISEGRVLLWLSQDYLDHVEVQRISPEPSAQRLSPTGILYEFELADEGQGGDVTLHVEARRIGRLSGRLGFAPAHSLAFIQWIYP